MPGDDRPATVVMPSWWQLATGDGTPKQAARIALIVGTVLVAINQGDVILAGLTPVWWKACLTYCVPFCVATWGAVTAKRTHLRRAAAGSEQTGVSPAG